MTQKHHQKVVLVGDGMVGSAFSYALMQQGVAEELAIVDVAKDYAAGDALDLEDAAPWTYPKQVTGGHDYQVVADADIVVITAGVGRKPGQTRLELIDKNLTIVKQVVDNVMAEGFTGIFVVATNPVDIITLAVQQFSGLPEHRVIGTGTALDTARLQVALAEQYGVAPAAIDVLVLGEHGDSAFANFDEAQIGGQSLNDFNKKYGNSAQDLVELMEATTKKGGAIIGRKGATFYGVATALARIVRAILRDESMVLPVSAWMSGQYGLSDMYIGSPAVINGDGAKTVIMAALSPAEQMQMQRSAEILRAVTADALANFMK